MKNNNLHSFRAVFFDLEKFEFWKYILAHNIFKELKWIWRYIVYNHIYKILELQSTLLDINMQSFNPSVSVGAVPILLCFNFLNLLSLLSSFAGCFLSPKNIHTQPNCSLKQDHKKSVKIYAVVNCPYETFNVACKLQVSFMLPCLSQFSLKSVGVRQDFQGTHGKLDKMIICEGPAWNFNFRFDRVCGAYCWI